MVRARRATFWWLYLPPVGWLGLFFIVPLVLMAALSLRADMQGDLLSFWAPSLEQYRTILAIGSYWRLLAISIVMAYCVALAAVALAYPIAYFLVFRAGRAATLFLLLLMIPFWASFLLRVVSLNFLRGSEGVSKALL